MKISQLTHFIKRNYSILSGSMATTLSRSVTLLTGFLTVAIATRIFSPEEFGLWSIFQSLISFGLVFDFGLRSAMGNRLAATVDLVNPTFDTRSKELYFSVFYIQVYIAIIGLLALFCLHSFFSITTLIKAENILSRRDLDQLVYIVLIILFVTMPFLSSTQVFFAYQEIKLESFLTSIQGIVLLCVFFYVQSVHLNTFSDIVILYFSTYLVSWVLRTTYLLLRRKWAIAFVPLNRQFYHLKSILSVSIDFFFLHTSAIFVSNAGTLLSGVLVSLSDAGLYNILQKIFNLVTSFHMAFLSAFGPYFTRDAYHGNWKDIKKRLKFSLYVTVPVFFVGIGFISWVLHPLIIELWTGLKVKSYAIAGILAFTSLLYGCGNSISFLLNSLGLIRIQVILSILSVALYIVLATILSVPLGIFGVAYANLFAVIPSVLSLSFYVRNVLKKNIMRV